MNNYIVRCIMFLVVMGVIACGEQEPAAPAGNVVAPVNDEPPLSQPPPVVLPEEQLADQLRQEMESLQSQREEAEQEKSRLLQEAQDIRRAIDEADDKTEELQSKIEQLEVQQ
jgi:peptidoglycan hydrolase CwlO-like protein